VKGLLLEEGIGPGDVVAAPGQREVRLSARLPHGADPEAVIQALTGTLAPLGYGAQRLETEGEGQVLRLEQPAEEGGLPVVLTLIRQAPPRVAPPASPAARRPRVAIVIDDVGMNLDLVRRASALPVPLTFSVLPGLPSSAESARIAVKRGREVILHLPMEPDEYPEKDPGPGALLTGMAEEEVERVLGEALRSVPGAKGMNNHMGSRLTTDPEAMRRLVRGIGSRRLYFLDSRTTPASVALQVAREAKLRSASRDVFLDNVEEEGAIREQLERMVRIGRENGSAIAIGHLKEPTIAALGAFLPRLKAAGVEVVPLGSLVQ
jgi:hypothetical protein